MDMKQKGPGAANAQALPAIIKLAGFDAPEDSRSTLHLQAARLRERFLVSWPMARAVAELAFATQRRFG